jgi:ketosteroid isomerase-like protein
MTQASRMSHEATQGSDDLEIRRLIEARQQAHASKDASAIAAPYSRDAVRYDLAPPLVHRGVDRADLDQWLATWAGPITIDTPNLEIAVDGALAVAHGLAHMRGRKVEGDPRDVDLWFRTTSVLKKRNGGWQIVHEHESVPFYMDGSLRAAVDLKPAS